MNIFVVIALIQVFGVFATAHSMRRREALESDLPIPSTPRPIVAICRQVAKAVLYTTATVFVIGLLLGGVFGGGPAYANEDAGGAETSVGTETPEAQDTGELDNVEAPAAPQTPDGNGEPVAPDTPTDDNADRDDQIDANGNTRNTPETRTPQDTGELDNVEAPAAPQTPEESQEPTAPDEPATAPLVDPDEVALTSSFYPGLNPELVARHTPTESLIAWDPALSTGFYPGVVPTAPPTTLSPAPAGPVTINYYTIGGDLAAELGLRGYFGLGRHPITGEWHYSANFGVVGGLAAQGCIMCVWPGPAEQDIVTGTYLLGQVSLTHLGIPNTGAVVGGQINPFADYTVTVFGGVGAPPVEKIEIAGIFAASVPLGKLESLTVDEIWSKTTSTAIVGPTFGGLVGGVVGSRVTGPLSGLPADMARYTVSLYQLKDPVTLGFDPREVYAHRVGIGYHPFNAHPIDLHTNAAKYAEAARRGRSTDWAGPRIGLPELEPAIERHWQDLQKGRRDPDEGAWTELDPAGTLTPTVVGPSPMDPLPMQGNP